ncbi:hypothetical protein N9435_07060 [Pseudomonadales bacterium]|nr:hypothetical protein [Gammaproteobacteria bacterium]MDB3989468.1 hypothetical protein [Pseudomonadales bacterium]
MNYNKTWKPLIITGFVLAINGLIFLLIGQTTDTDSFWGLAAGCAGSGVALLIVGMLHRKKAFERT